MGEVNASFSFCCSSVVESVSQTNTCCFVELLTALRCLQIANVYHFHFHYNCQCKHISTLSAEAAGSDSCKRKGVGATQVPTQLQYLLLVPLLFSFSKLPPSEALATTEPTKKRRGLL